MRRVILAASLYLLASCSVENVELDTKGAVEINNATSNLIENAKLFLSENSIKSMIKDTKFDLDNYALSDLKEVVVNVEGKSGRSFGVLSKEYPEMTLAFKVDDKGEFELAFYGETILQPYGVVDTKIYDLDGNLRIYFTTENDVIIFHEVPAIIGGRATGWFSDTLNCFDAIMSPTGDPLTDAIFDIAMMELTAGWILPVGIAACAIKTY